MTRKKGNIFRSFKYVKLGLGLVRFVSLWMLTESSQYVIHYKKISRRQSRRECRTSHACSSVRPFRSPQPLLSNIDQKADWKTGPYQTSVDLSIIGSAITGRLPNVVILADCNTITTARVCGSSTPSRLTSFEVGTRPRIKTTACHSQDRGRLTNTAHTSQVLGVATAGDRGRARCQSTDDRSGTWMCGGGLACCNRGRCWNTHAV